MLVLAMQFSRNKGTTPPHDRAPDARTPTHKPGPVAPHKNTNQHTTVRQPHPQNGTENETNHPHQHRRPKPQPHQNRQNATMSDQLEPADPKATHNRQPTKRPKAP
jgi:hypothetical protein